MATANFDSLSYFEKLKAAGVPEEQAKVQASALKELFDNRLINRDYLDARLAETELRLQKEMEKAKYDLLKWQIGIAIVILTIMAKGFGWLGF